MRNVVGAGNLQKRFARIAALDRLAFLVVGEFGFAPELHSARFGTSTPFARANLRRRDGDNSPLRNDWAVGTTLLLMLLGYHYCGSAVQRRVLNQ